MNKGFLYLFCSFFLWSTSAYVVVGFKGILPPFQSASAVIILSTIVIFIVAHIKNENILNDIFSINKESWFKIIILGCLGFFFYPIFYFYGLHSNRPLEANVINYFWPLIGVLIGFLIKLESITFKKILSIIFGFLGSIVTTLNIRGLIEEREYMVCFDLENLNAYVLAFLGAFSYGIYTALLKSFKVKNNANKEVSIITKFLCFLIASTILHILCNLSLLMDSSLIYKVLDFKFINFIYLVFYSLFNFALAYFCWVKAVDLLPISHVSIMAFLIPTFSSFILAFFRDINFESNSIYGLLLILIGLSFHQDNKRYISPLTGTYISLAVIASSAFILPFSDLNTINNRNILSIVKILVAVYSILFGFILTRSISNYINENKLFLKIENQLYKLCKTLKEQNSIQNKIDQYMQFLIENNSMFGGFSKKEHYLFSFNNHNFLNQLLQEVDQSEIIERETKKDVIDYIFILRDNTSEWGYSRKQKISIFEWIILYSLVIVMGFAFFIARENTFIYQITTIIFCASLILSLLVLQDYNLRRPREKIHFALVTQKISSFLTVPPYVPKELVEYSFFDKYFLPENQNVMRVRTLNDNGEITIQNIIISFDYFKIISYVLLSIILLGILYTFVDKYNLISS